MKRLPLSHRRENDCLSQSFGLFHVSPDGAILFPFLQRGRSGFRARLLSGEHVMTDAEGSNGPPLRSPSSAPRPGKFVI